MKEVHHSSLFIEVKHKPFEEIIEDIDCLLIEAYANHKARIYACFPMLIRHKITQRFSSNVDCFVTLLGKPKFILDK